MLPERSRRALARLALLAALWAPGCNKTPVRREIVGGVLFALPGAFREKSKVSAASAGLVERIDGAGSRVLLGWDVDARPGTPPLDEALRAAGLVGAHPEGRLRVAGHSALLFRSAQGAALVWRCEKTSRTLRLLVEGPHAPAVEELAAQVDCHVAQAKVNGEVATASSAVLGSAWHLAHRAPGSVTFLRDEAVLTLFAGQIAPPPPDAEAARRAAPSWALAAGLQDAVAGEAGLSAGPQGHPALRVSGTATLEGRPVRFVSLSWRCLQRQRSFVALVFARAGEEPEGGLDPPLLSARCHG